MRYDEAITRLYSLRARGVRMGVQRMRAALRHRRFDVHATPFIVVAGTNGKGSVSAMIAASLQAAGYRTGLFTSPHLHRFTERIRIDGKPIGTREAAQRIASLLEDFSRPRAPEATFFELSTLMALETFREHACDVAVLEVGLGGRLDAVNALPSCMTVITRIALDHMDYLGDTLTAIAREKAGILRPGVPLVLGARAPEAQRAVLARARRVGSPVWLIDRDFSVGDAANGGIAVRLGKTSLGPFTLALAGEHQRDNAACAVAALSLLKARGFRVPERSMRSGLRRVRWPGRLEHLPGKPGVLLDAAHNPDGAETLARYLDALPRTSRRVLVFGAMRDKDYRAMLRSLAPCFDAIVYVAPNLPRAASPTLLARARRGEPATSIERGVARARSLAGRAGLVVVAGSIFVVAEARARLLGLRADPPIRM